MRELKLKTERDNLGRFVKGHTKIGGINKGDRMSVESRAKIAAVLYGKRGSLARNWRGGKTQEHTIIRYSTEMKLWRKAVFERDDYTCQDCKARGVKLNADHIKPFAHFPELRLDVKNGRTLCVDCHRKTPTFGARKASYAQ